jgi:hypothetical protein
MKKWIALLIAGIVASTALIGCKSEEPSSSATGAAADTKTEKPAAPATK